LPVFNGGAPTGSTCLHWMHRGSVVTKRSRSGPAATSAASQQPAQVGSEISWRSLVIRGKRRGAAERGMGGESFGMGRMASVDSRAKCRVVPVKQTGCGCLCQGL
jgi:hypothetical protein